MKKRFIVCYEVTTEILIKSVEKHSMQIEVDVKATRNIHDYIKNIIMQRHIFSISASITQIMEI